MHKAEMFAQVGVCVCVCTCSVGSESEKNGLPLPRDEVSPGQSPSSAVSHPSFFPSVYVCLKIFPPIQCFFKKYIYIY